MHYQLLRESMPWRVCWREMLSVTACFFGFDITMSPSTMSLVDARLLEAAYSFSLSFLRADLSRSSTCHSASHARSVGGRARGSLSLSFLPISNSAEECECGLLCEECYGIGKDVLQLSFPIWPFQRPRASCWAFLLHHHFERNGGCLSCGP